MTEISDGLRRSCGSYFAAAEPDPTVTRRCSFFSTRSIRGTFARRAGQPARPGWTLLSVTMPSNGVQMCGPAYPRRPAGPGTARVLVHGELRLGGERHAESSRDSTVTSWAAIGPNIAWQRGRFSLAGAFGLGIENITAQPRRLNIGMVW